jgi:integrase/recombinase XerC
MESNMRKTQLTLTNSLPVGELARNIQGWLLDGEVRQHSPNTLARRRIVTEKLIWFLRHKELEQCGAPELRAFLAYLGNGHETEGGRWGNPQLTRKVRPTTVSDYYRDLRALLNFLVADGVLEASPLANIKPPIARPDQIQPFTTEQQQALIQAAKKSRHPRRDEAMILFLLDTGVRASELCELKRKDLDLQGRSARVLGKGTKYRTVYYGPSTTRALWAYLREEAREEEQPLFLSDRGLTAGEALTRNGLLQFMRRMGKTAKIEATRCSPHTFRHTFAVEFLRGGGNQMTLMHLMGHTGLQMTARYLALAQADLAEQHRQYSPVERMKGKGAK